MRQSEKYYKAVHQDGTRLAESKNTPGAVRGSLLSNENNQLAGQAEFIEVEVEPQYVYVEVEREEENELSEEAKEAIKVISEAIVDIGVHILKEHVFPPIKIWANDTAAPQIKKMWHFVTGKKTPLKAQQAKSDTRAASLDVQTSNSMPSMLVNGLNIAYEKYTSDSNSVEVKRELLDIAIQSAMLADKIKNFTSKYADTNAVSNDFLEWQSVVEKVTSKNFVESLNAILKNDVTFLNQEHSKFLGDILGYDIVHNGQFIPIENDIFAQALSLKNAA